jgi:hypothetical protein
MKVRALLPLAAVVGGCANPGLPPGGPPDTAPPRIVRVTPDSGSVNVRASEVVFRFNEVVSEQPGRGVSLAGGGSTAGAQGAPPGGGLGALVLVSPGDGRERVTWRRTAIEVAPRRGFRPNTTFRVTLLPGVSDLRGNVLTEAREVVFSTGQFIPDGAIGGAVFDWVEGRHVPGAAIEVFQPTDTAFRWIARADSLGRYTVRDLVPGVYRLRAWIDTDRDRRLGEREAFDSLTFRIHAAGDAPRTADLYAFVHDTLGPRIESAEPVDSTALLIRFDRAVAPDWVPLEGSFQLQRADSSTVALGEVLPRARFDSLAAAARAATDSAARAADPAAAAPAPPAAAPTPAAVADTATQPAKPTRGIPTRDWAVRLPTALEPGSYRLRAMGVRGLGGTARTSEREVRIPEPAPPDTVSSPPVTPPVTPPATPPVAR